MSDTLTLPATGTYQVDPVHSSVNFVARHLVGSKVRGRFTRFEGTITVGDDPLASSVEATIDAASVDTHEPARDEDLRSANFLDVEHYPTITFRSTGLRPSGDAYVLEGDLTIHGVTRRVELALEYHGYGPDPFGGTRAGFTATTTISRKDFGLTYNAVIEAGRVVVGDAVTVTLEIEAIKAS